MGKTGFRNELFIVLEHNYDAYKSVYTSKEVINLNKSLSDTFILLKELYKSKDIDSILNTEHIMLYQELALYANSSEEINSIKKSIAQIQEAKISLNVVNNSHYYQEATKTYSAKNKEAGLPLDSLRQFIKSHTARLSNRMTGNLSVPEKNILRQRKENLSMVKELYINMQREALGLAVLNKSKGIDR